MTDQIDPIVEELCREMQRRSQVGIKKYNATLARTDLSLRDWLQHALEECLDMAGYLKAAITKLDAQETDNGR